MEESGSSTSRARYYFRVLRPLLWWLLFVLVLYCIRTHQRLMEDTRLTYGTTLNGIPFAADARLDGQPILPGDKVLLGFHTFTVTGQNLEPFSTNFFVWYGGKDLGAIRLNRIKGVLSLRVKVIPGILTIEGQEYSLTLTNSPGLSVSVPTGDYMVTARYPYSTWQERVKVFKIGSIPVTIDPQLGTLQLDCNQSGATYELLRLNVEPMLSGNLPATLTGLPANAYKVVARHHDLEWSTMFYLKADTTNTVQVEFEYGTAVIQSTPSGAAVIDSSGRQLGVTPLTVTELQPGSWSFELRQDDYEPVATTISIMGNQTNIFHTNLINQEYATAIRTTRQYIQERKYDLAIQAVSDALKVQPGDPVAIRLQNDASAFGCISKADTLAKGADYSAAIKELEQALAIVPGNETAKQMLLDCKTQLSEQLEERRKARMNLGRQAFEALLKQKYPDGDLFETHEMTTSKSLKDIELPLLDALKGEPLKLTVTKYNEVTDLFEIEAVQEFSTALATSAGRRQLVMVGAQTKDDEAHILFKVLEYKAEAVEKLSIGNLIGAPASVNLVPIRATGETNKLQLRLAEGVSNVMVTVRGVIGH